MKKIILLTALATMLLAFTSCQKEGVYNPSKKISKIYYQSGSGAKYLVERWTWDGNKLSKITDANGKLSESFSYDGSRVSKVTGSDGEIYTFYYDGSKITKVECKYQGKVLAQLDFSHKSSKISKLDIHYYNNSSKSISQLSTFNHLFSDLAQDLMTSEKSRANYDTYITYEFTYSGSNMTKMTYHAQEGNSTMEYERTYKYDKKKNPYYNFFSSSFVFMCLSENNPTQYEHIAGANVYTYEYSYTYDGSYPTESMRLSSDGSTATTFYEYE
ncbi:hypothetical protein FACS1894178_4630 [Bacteroidia bacterium]|nr:hypothetical protein FACS1894178_4630 [Bacteroidia bacterium]